MHEILILQADPRAAATLVEALQPPHRLKQVRDLKRLETLLAGTSPRACVLDVSEAPGGVSLAALRRLRQNHPTVPLVVTSDFRNREMDLYHLGRLNVDGIVRMEDSPSPREILSVLDRAVTGSLATRVVLATARELPQLAQAAIHWAIEHADHKPQVSDLAGSLGMNPRALLREMKAMGLVSPRDLLLWGRLIRASHLLEESSETVEAIAFRLGYATGGALGKALKRHVGHSPTSLASNGGLTRALEVFGATGLWAAHGDNGP